MASDPSRWRDVGNRTSNVSSDVMTGKVRCFPAICRSKSLDLRDRNLTSSDDLIDAHIHFWDPGRLHYEWLEALPALQRPFLPADVETGRHEVHGFVFVQADCRDDEGWAEVAWACTLPVVGIVGYAGLHRGEAVRADVARLAGEPLVV